MSEPDGTIPVPNVDLIGRSIETEYGQAVILTTASYNSAYVVIQYPTDRAVSVRRAEQVRQALKQGGLY